MNVVEGARAVIADSGGIQEEATYLGIPCLTLRENTERPITITDGTNRLVATSGLNAALAAVIRNGPGTQVKPSLSDSCAATRSAAALRCSAFW